MLWRNNILMETLWKFRPTLNENVKIIHKFCISSHHKIIVSGIFQKVTCGKHAFNEAPFNSIYFLSVLAVQMCIVQGLARLLDHFSSFKYNSPNFSIIRLVVFTTHLGTPTFFLSDYLEIVCLIVSSVCPSDCMFGSLFM